MVSAAPRASPSCASPCRYPPARSATSPLPRMTGGRFSPPKTAARAFEQSEPNCSRLMSEIQKRKTGFWDRLLGRQPPDLAKPAESEKAPAPAASAYEGAPDFTTAAAAGDLPPVEATATQASTDLRADEKPAPELAGADLQPVEGVEP